jgi:hypothetical protein
MSEDSLSYYPGDGSALLLKDYRMCFVCKQPTMRLDINYEAPFCNSPECNKSIHADLLTIQST